MATQDDIRSDLENDVFSELGKTVTLISKSSPLYNSRGELEGYSTSSSSITVVPYNLFNNTVDQEFGRTTETEVEMAVPYNITINLEDEIVMEGVTYLVKQVNPNYLPGNVVTIIKVVRKNP